MSETNNNHGVTTNNATEIPSRLKTSVQGIVRLLDGFTQKDALHALQCAQEELGEMALNGLISSSDFTISS